MDTQPNSPLVFITGVSSGIGKALALLLLELGYRVHGLGRRSVIQHKHYSFTELDLASCKSVHDFRFPAVQADKIILVNNAGMIGEIVPVTELSSEDIQNTMQVNTISPQILTSHFLKTYTRAGSRLHVINISSGAGKRAIDAWSVYCASKAALDLFSVCVAEELKQRGTKNIYIHAVEPGVVDTAMQGKIREASSSKFLASERFHHLKKNGDLASPDQVAVKLLWLVENPEKVEQVLFSLRDLN